MRNPKNFTRKPLELINTLNKVSGYKLGLKIRNCLYIYIPMAHRLKNKDHGNTRTYITLIWREKQGETDTERNKPNQGG